MKKISDSKRILVGWGRKGKKLIYFLSHNSLKKKVICSSKDLQDKLEKLVTSIDKGVPKKKQDLEDTK